MIHDVLLRELAMKERPELLVKFWIWAERNRKHVWIGHWWSEISAKEIEPTTILGWHEAMHADWTRDFRRNCSRVLRQPLDLADLIRTAKADSHEKERREFVRRCEEFTLWMDQQHSDWRTRLSSEEKQVEFIRTPQIVADYALEGSERMRKNAEAWKPALLQFPDRLSIGRWTRIIVWYMVQRSIGATKEFENNWDDAHYAHLASYTGAILTRDKKLTRLLNAVFPHVRVFTN